MSGDGPHTAVCTDRKGRHGMTALWEALGALVVAGVDLDLSALWTDYADPADEGGAKESLLKQAVVNL